jgi:thioredoxin-like negative regulator of GroEL
LALEADERAAEALPHAQEALAREPTDASAAVLVRVLLALGRTDEAAQVVSGRSWTDAAARSRAEGAVALARGDPGASTPREIRS